MNSVQQAQQRLQSHWQLLRQQWQATVLLWLDPVRYHFERRFWQEWEKTVPAALAAMERLGQVLEQARRNVCRTR